MRGASAAMPLAPVTPRVCAPVGIPTGMPAVRIPGSAPPEPNAGVDVSPDARSGSAPPIRPAPPRVSIGRGQSKSDAERQDESGKKQFQAGVNALPRRGIPSRVKNPLRMRHAAFLLEKRGSTLAGESRHIDQGSARPAGPKPRTGRRIRPAAAEFFDLYQF